MIQQNTSLQICNLMEKLFLEDYIQRHNVFSNIFCYIDFRMQNKCPTLYEKKVGDGFDFPSDKSSVSFWTVRVGWVNQMVQSVCDGCWAQVCPDFTPVQFKLLENTSFCTLAWLNNTRVHRKFGFKIS